MTVERWRDYFDSDSIRHCVRWGWGAEWGADLTIPNGSARACCRFVKLGRNGSGWLRSFERMRCRRPHRPPPPRHPLWSPDTRSSGSSESRRKSMPVTRKTTFGLNLRENTPHEDVQMWWKMFNYAYFHGQFSITCERAPCSFLSPTLSSEAESGAVWTRRFERKPAMLKR